MSSRIPVVTVHTGELTPDDSRVKTRWLKTRKIIRAPSGTMKLLEQVQGPPRKTALAEFQTQLNPTSSGTQVLMQVGNIIEHQQTHPERSIPHARQNCNLRTFPQLPV